MTLYAKKIRDLQLPYVKEVQVIGEERPGVEPWITISFSPYITEDRFRPVLDISSNLYIEDTTYNAYHNFINVPFGKEKYYKNKLATENITERVFLIYTDSFYQFQRFNEIIAIIPLLFSFIFSPILLISGIVRFFLEKELRTSAISLLKKGFIGIILGVLLWQLLFFWRNMGIQLF